MDRLVPSDRANPLALERSPYSEKKLTFGFNRRTRLSLLGAKIEKQFAVAPSTDNNTGGTRRRALGNSDGENSITL